MADDALPLLGILGAVADGFAWGRISSRLPLPEWLRLLATPLWTGSLAVILGWVVSVARLDWSAPRIVDASHGGALAVTRLAVGYGCICFLVGAVFGLPAAIGWVIGYSKPLKN